VDYYVPSAGTGTWTAQADHYLGWDYWRAYCYEYYDYEYQYTDWAWLNPTYASVYVPLPALTYIGWSPPQFIAPGCAPLSWDSNFPTIDLQYHLIEGDLYGYAYDYANGSPSCAGEEDTWLFGHWEITAVHVPGGAWVAPPTAATLYIQAPPYLHTAGNPAGNCGTVVRGGSITVLLENAADLIGIVWRFVSNQGTITNQNAGNAQWAGTMVASGTIRVEYTGGFRECNVNVTNRNWSVTLPPLDHANGSPMGWRGIALPQPPTQGSHLGAFAFDFDSGPNTSAGLGSEVTVDAGPNKDFKYFTVIPSGWNAYWINPDLDYTNPGQHSGKPNTEFARKQCGNYNGTNAGFISWDNLVAQTRRHEFDHATASHRGKLATVLAQAATNPGIFLENKIWGPGTNTSANQFETQVATDFIALVAGMRVTVGVHDFPAANESAGGAPLGNINLTPYQTQPFCP